MLREVGDPARQAGKKMGSWHQTVEEVRSFQNVRRHGERARHDTKAPLCTEYVSFVYHVQQSVVQSARYY
jgi:hypothetical protein